ncbi:MAG: multicopper oxidase domain-containing protein [Methylococcaceae bacterium]|nr:multicopper oxidase domain-containing protein [Methylococcaceae bacterium]
MLTSTNNFKALKRKALPLAVASLIGSGLYQAPASAILPTSACSSASGAATCTLFAKTGTATLPSAGATTVLVPTWGYTGTVGGTVVQPGGPVLVVNQGDVVTVTLTNNLTETTGLLFQGQNLPPDTTGVVAGGTKSYTFTASAPGTYLYEAGLLENKQHQPALGLYGALVVRPAASATQAYTDVSTAFNDEALVLVSEIDTALNNSANPALFDMRKFAPKYFLINGKAHPSPDVVTLPDPTTYTSAGFNLLLRYVNAGVKHHSMATLGLRQQFIANDGNLIANPRNGVSETIAPGQTVDAITMIPATAVSGSKFAVYDAGLNLNNSNTAGMGGMLTFVALAGTAPAPGNPPAIPGNPPDTVGPATTGVAMVPNPSNGTGTVVLNATGNDTTTGNSNVASANYAIDGGAATPMNPVDADAPVRSFTANINAAGLTEGTHPVTVTSTDTIAGLPSAAVNLIIDKSAPTVGTAILPAVAVPISATPNPTNGAIGVNSSTAAVRVQASLSDAFSTVAAGELFIDPAFPAPVGTGIILVPSDGSFNTATETGYADIPLATILALSNGPHTIYMRGKDAAGNWGNATAATNTAAAWPALAKLTLTVDKVVPTISSATLSPNSGTVALGAASTLTLTVVGSDVGTGLNGGQYTLDGGVAIPFVGLSASIATNTLLAGTHAVSVRLKDLAGNFSTASNVALNVVSAVNDSYNINANTSTTQNGNVNAAAGVLGNDQPLGVAGRTATLVSGPTRTFGAGAGTISSFTLNTNGSFIYTLTGVGANGTARQTSKRGTFQFTYRENLNGVQSAPATVTITVN